MASWRNRFRRLLKPRTRTVLTPAEGYRRWAATYGQEPNELQRLEAPALETLLPEVAGRRILDLGCGKGRVARLVRQRGGRAVAADRVLAMLSACDAVPGPKLVATLGSPLPFPRASFDGVVCALALGHVEGLSSALAAMVEVLRPGGFLLLSDFHPYATLRGWERTFVDPTGQTCAVGQNLHLLSDYVRQLGRLGLVVEALEEPLWRGSPVVFVLRARLSPSRR
ncbi:MAG: class I SAM-dependent methyltransferase [Acidobacteriota bacterium]